MNAVVTGLLLLAALAVLAVLARRVPVPLPLLLIAGGIGLAFVPGFGAVSIDPDMFFVLFIPPLLYADGWFTPRREFVAVLRPVLLLAFGLVLMTVVAVGLLLHAMVPTLPLAAAFALGAIVSPTDAVATSAMVGRVGMPARAVHVLNGESLINDASGLVAFKFAVAALATGAFSLGRAAIELVLLAGGGTLIGLAVAWCVGRLRSGLRERAADDPVVQAVLSVLTPFAAYLAADGAGTSGILAVVAAGLYSGWTEFRALDAASRRHTWEVWAMLLFAFNGIVFLLLGLSLAHTAMAFEPYQWRAYSVVALALWAALTVLRLAWVYPAKWLPQVAASRVREREGPGDARETFVIGWAGLRGSVTMAAALSIPFTLADGSPLPGRDLLIFLAAATIVLTLLLNGLTLPLLVRALGLASDRGAQRDLRAAEIALAQAASLALERELVRLPESEAVHARRLLADYRRRLERQTANAGRREALRDARAAEHRLALLAIAAERRELYALRDAGTINDVTLREIESRIDHEEMLVTGEWRTTT